MRARCVVIAAIGLSALAPASAAAQDPMACAIGGGPWEYQARLSQPLSPTTTLLHHGIAAAHERLGSQFGGLWFSDREQGWAVGVAPGALTLEQARTAIVDALAARVSGEGLDTLTSMLRVHAQPYGWADLEAVQAQLLSRLAELDSSWSAGISCPDGDVFRVQVWLYRDATPDSIARAQEIVAPFGDRARLTVTDMGPPTPVSGGALAPSGGGTPPPRLRRLIALPRDCVRAASARVRVRRGARAIVRRLAVTVSGDRRVRAGRRIAVAVSVPLGERPTRVRIAVRLSDGRAARGVIALRRCA